MRLPSKETLTLLRSRYPKGARVELIRMDDPQAPPIGTKGTVLGVDDMGSILVAWDNGSGLNVIKNPNQFSDSANGVSVGTPSNGYPSKFTVKTNGGFPLFIPTAANGSDSTYSCDYWHFYSSGPCLFVGGSYNQNTGRGLFYVYCNDASYSGADIGCRLQELP